MNTITLEGVTYPTRNGLVPLTLPADSSTGASVNERMSLLAGFGTWAFNGTNADGSTRRSIGNESTIYSYTVVNGVLTAYTNPNAAMGDEYGTFTYNKSS